MIECKQCGECCKELLISIPIFSDNLEEFYRTRGFNIVNNCAEMLMPLRCPQLMYNNKCKIHNSKPLICKRFPLGLNKVEVLPRCAWKGNVYEEER